jgi:hypothetical protein
MNGGKCLSKRKVEASVIESVKYVYSPKHQDEWAHLLVDIFYDQIKDELEGEGQQWEKT